MSTTSHDLIKLEENFDEEIPQQHNSQRLPASFLNARDDSDEDRPLLQGVQPKTRSTSYRVIRFVLSLITWPRVKILVIIAVLLLAVYLFSAEDVFGQGLAMYAVSKTSPVILDMKNFKAPVDIVRVDMTTQELPDTTSPIPTLQVTLERLANNWEPFERFSVEPSTTSEITKYFQFDVLEDKHYSYRFNISSSSAVPVAFTFHTFQTSSFVEYEVLFAALILIGVYVLIIFELVHRTIAAFWGSFIALAVLSNLHNRPDLGTIISWIDFETCALLFGMMVMVGIFSQTGFFEWTAVKAYKLSKGNMWHLSVILCFFTAVVSAFLDNVTTILLLVPVTIRLCNVLDVPPTQLIIALVMYSNLGGTATPIGDPPNIIIVNSKLVLAATKLDFVTFTMHMAPGVILSCFTAYFVIKRVAKSSLHREPNVHKKGELEVWKKTLRKLREETTEEKEVKQKMREYIARLETEINEPTVLANITELEEKYRINNFPLFVNSCVVLGTVIILFFLHGVLPVHLSLAWIAIIGAMALLVISGIRDIEEVLEKVEFGTLMFFAALFVLMRSLEELGLIEWIGDQTVYIIAQVPSGIGRECVAIILLLWISAFASAFIDNIPYTAAMVPIAVSLGTSDLQLPIQPLLWALSYGTCLGGNATLIGASANVVAAGIAESQGYPISFNTFFKTGFVVMIVSVATVNLYLLIFHVFIAWY